MRDDDLIQLAHVYDFDRQMAMSQGVGGEVDAVLLGAVPGAIAVRAVTNREDRNGTDRWVRLENNDELSIDVKARDLDPIEEYDEDDLALESWSVIDTKLGWTLDPMKRTDYVLWWWKPTGRWCLVPFPLLRAVFAEHQAAWMSSYRVCQQETWGRRSDWKSECVFVPRKVVWRAIYQRFGGMPQIPQLTLGFGD